MANSTRSSDDPSTTVVTAETSRPSPSSPLHKRYLSYYVSDYYYDEVIFFRSSRPCNSQINCFTFLRMEISTKEKRRATLEKRESMSIELEQRRLVQAS